MKKVWLVRAGKVGQQEDMALEHGLAIIGFHQLPSLSGLHTRENIAAAVDAAYPDDNDKARLNYTSQVHAFVNRIAVGDIVALPRT